MGRFSVVKLLLDTHSALWWWTDPRKLGQEARAVMESPDSKILFSAASAYEVAQKVRLGKLRLPSELSGNGLLATVIKEGWELQALTPAQMFQAASFDHPHRDPFDRMLGAQAFLGDLSLASRDPFFGDLKLKVIW